MISLITAKDVRTRLALPDDEGVNASIKSCIIGATLRASSLLQSEFESVRRMSIFFVDKRMEVSSGGVYILRLSDGFITDGAIVRVGNSFEEMIEDGGELLKKAYPNLEKGWVYVLSADVVGKFVSVIADYGFSSSDQVPDWLKEVVLGLTIKMLTAQQISDGKAQLSNAVPVLDQHILAMVDSHKRTSSICVSPIYTDIVVV